jgi:hypothetical protein
MLNRTRIRLARARLDRILARLVAQKEEGSGPREARAEERRIGLMWKSKVKR